MNDEQVFTIGRDFEFLMVFTKPDGSRKNITGWTLRARLYPRSGSGDAPLLNLPPGTGTGFVEITNGPQGEARVKNGALADTPPCFATVDVTRTDTGDDLVAAWPARIVKAGTAISDFAGNITIAETGAVNLLTQIGEKGDTGPAAAWGTISGTLTAQSDLNSALNLKAPVASPDFTGIPTAPTQSSVNNSTRIATTAFVATAIANLVNSSPASLDTLIELAAALGNDANFSTTVLNALALKAPLAAPDFSGNPTAVTQAPGNASTRLATTAFVAALGALKADLDSPDFTGNPKAVTQAPGNNSTRLATTAFVQDVAAPHPAIEPLTWFWQTASGDILLGTANDGTLIIGPVNYKPVISLAVQGFYDSAGTAIAELNGLGVSPEALSYDAWVYNGQVYGLVNGSQMQLTGLSIETWRSAEIHNGVFAAVRADGRRFATPLRGAVPDLDAAITAIEYSDLYGQSNAAGNASGAVINGTAFNARFLMFAEGQRAYGNALGHSQNGSNLQAEVQDAVHDFVSGFEELMSAAGETSNSGFAHGVLSQSNLAASSALLTTCSAVGSANAEMLWRVATENTNPLWNAIGDPWRNLEARFARAAIFWRFMGYDFVAGPLRHNQGEGNINRTKANHLAALVSFRDDWQALAAQWNCLRTIGGFPGKAPFIVAQTVNGPKYSFVKSEVPWAQLQINIDDPTTALCIGPMYDQVHAADGIHLLSAGQEMQGARQAVAYNAWLRGESYKPLYVRKDGAFQPTRTTTNVRLRIYNHFALSLTFDTTLITGLGSAQGFKWFDNGDGNAVTVTNAAIVDSTTVDLTLSAVPTGTGGAIEIAMTGANNDNSGPTSGNRSSLRTTGGGITTRGGTAVNHFICIDRVTVI